jgi:hypothetical protein
MPGASAALHNLGRMPSSGEANLITSCKNCEFSVFRQQPRVWQFRPRPGWVHADCDNPNGASA